MTQTVTTRTQISPKDLKKSILSIDQQHESIEELDALEKIEEHSNSLTLKPYLEAFKIHNRERSNIIIARWVFILLFAALLAYQNITVFNFVFKALKPNLLKDLQPIIVAITSATLAESYLIVKIMVQFVFKDMNYDELKNPPQRL